MMLQHLVSEQIARDLIDGMRAARADEAGSARVTAGELLAHVVRDPAAPVDLRMERMLRTDAELRARYRRLLSSNAVGHSAMAMAAGTGAYPDRRVGAYDLRVVEDGAETYVILSASKAGKLPSALEAIGSADSVRIPLSEPVRGHIQIAIDPQNDSLSRLLKLLGEATTELYLI